MWGVRPNEKRLEQEMTFTHPEVWIDLKGGEPTHVNGSK